MPQGEFSIEVLDDGTLSIDSNKFPDQIHKSADEAMDLFRELMGGDVITKKKFGKAGHTHHHDHVHEHEHIGSGGHDH